MARLTSRTVAKAACPPGVTEATWWDDLLVGFGLRVRASGVKTWIVRYPRGRQKKKYKIGPVTLYSADEARERARAVLQLVQDGKDPAQEKRERREGKTVAELADLFLEDRKDTPGHRTYKSVIENHVKPILGHLVVRSLVESDCTDFLRKVKRGHTGSSAVAVRSRRRRIAGGKSITWFAHATLSGIFTLAESEGLRPENSNPMAKIDAERQKPRRMVVRKGFYTRLGAGLRRMAIEQSAPPGALLAIWLLALGGCRHNEIRQAPLSQCDPDQQTIHLPETKTGERLILLGAAAAQMVRDRLAAAGPDDVWLIEPVHGRKKPVVLQPTWDKLRREIGMPKLRMHDLRHSFSTMGNDLHVAYPFIQALLGHSTGTDDSRAPGMRGTTAEYIHVGFEAARDAADRIAAAIFALMTADAEAWPAPASDEPAAPDEMSALPPPTRAAE